jgi:hypothetical protein
MLVLIVAVVVIVVVAHCIGGVWTEECWMSVAVTVSYSIFRVRVIMTKGRKRVFSELKRDTFHWVE